VSSWPPLLLATALAACSASPDDDGSVGDGDAGSVSPDATAVDGVAISGASATGGTPYSCDLTEWDVFTKYCSDVAVSFTLDNHAATPLDSFSASFQLPNGWGIYLVCSDPLPPGESVLASLTYAFERVPTLRWQCDSTPGMAGVRVPVTPVVVDSSASIYFDLVRGDEHEQLRIDLPFDVAD
jgi:hypothetical protein